MHLYPYYIQLYTFHHYPSSILLLHRAYPCPPGDSFVQPSPQMSKSTVPTTIRTWQYNGTAGGLAKNLVLNTSASVPKAGSTQHLVRIIATALNPVDYKPAEHPVIGKLIPKNATPGFDFAGTIITPASSSKLRAGQLVFGVTKLFPISGGGLSEIATTEASAVAILPEGLNPIDAATIGVAGLTAYQCIQPRVKKGDKVLINGGSGGTGVFGDSFSQLQRPETLLTGFRHSDRQTTGLPRHRNMFHPKRRAVQISRRGRSRRLQER